MVVPNKVYQAAAAGRPLVTRDGPGLREVLTPGEHCVACPPGDEHALADAVAALLDDPARAARLGATARAHVLGAFGAGAVAARLRALFHERLAIDPTGPSPARVAC
jgi:glycosyltransferase involved in cell wall biosynthesis